MEHVRRRRTKTASSLHRCARRQALAPATGTGTDAPAACACMQLLHAACTSQLPRPASFCQLGQTHKQRARAWVRGCIPTQGLGLHALKLFQLRHCQAVELGPAELRYTHLCACPDGQAEARPEKTHTRIRQASSGISQGRQDSTPTHRIRHATHHTRPTGTRCESWPHQPPHPHLERNPRCAPEPNPKPAPGACAHPQCAA